MLILKVILGELALLLSALVSVALSIVGVMFVLLILPFIRLWR